MDLKRAIRVFWYAMAWVVVVGLVPALLGGFYHLLQDATVTVTTDDFFRSFLAYFCGDLSGMLAYGAFAATAVVLVDAILYRWRPVDEKEHEHE